MSMLIFTISIPLSVHEQGTTTYVVQPEDSLWKIAVRYKVGLSEKMAVNPPFFHPTLMDPRDICVLDCAKQTESEVIRLTNEQRAKCCLRPLQTDWELARVARYKSVDMRDKNYFSHVCKSSFTMIHHFGISDRSAGENAAVVILDLVRGQRLDR
jgi:uncharacterized protein YkwD